MKAMKRILEVKIVREIDTDPDTSYLGDFGDSAKSDYAIDRAHSEDCASLEVLSDDGRNWLERIQYQIERVDADKDFYSEGTESALNTIEKLLETPDCDCSRAGRYNPRTYRYFNPNYQNYKGMTEDEIRTYTRQDYERMESLNNDHWCYLGIRADAEIAIAQGHSYSVQTSLGKRTEQAHQIQKITSGGLWGIESDSDKSYLAEVEQEELSALRTQLKALGFSTRAISTAFKNVEHKDE